MPKDFISQLSDNKTPPTYKFFDGSKWVESLNGKFNPIRSPVTGEILGFIPTVSQGEIDRAIFNLKKGRDNWQKIPLSRKREILHLAADWIREHDKVLTSQLINEIGKSHSEARDEILRSADMIDFFAQAAMNIKGEELSGDAYPGYDRTKTALVENVPRGIILAISPFNYPVNLAVSKIAPALIMGNSVLFKPATYGTISAIILTEIFRLAGLPDGVMATITGQGEDLGAYLATHPAVSMITFTGSSETGQKIAKLSGMIPLLFECGGNNPALILPDANIDETVTELIKGAFMFSGQRCTAIKYVIAFPSSIDKLLKKISAKIPQLFHLGDPRIPDNNFGPLISREAADLVEKRILLAKADGAQIVAGGKKEGNYIQPTVLTKVTPFMDIVRHETFGPVLSFIKTDSVKEALKIINDSAYGLQASIFTSDEGTALQLCGLIETGSVQINSAPKRGPDHFPFICVKGSGVGVQGISYSLQAMSRPKSVILNKPH